MKVVGLSFFLDWVRFGLSASGEHEYFVYFFAASPQSRVKMYLPTIYFLNFLIYPYFLVALEFRPLLSLSEAANFFWFSKFLSGRLMQSHSSQVHLIVSQRLGFIVSGFL